MSLAYRLPNSTVALPIQPRFTGMNSFDWNNPPPPGTELDAPEEESNFPSEKNDSVESSETLALNFEPPPKSPTVQGREEELTYEKPRLRSRTRSPDRRRRRKRSRSYSRRSRSYSRDRRRRSRSRSRRRRRKYSSSKSRSRSRSSSYRPRHRRHGRHYSRSRSRSYMKRTKTYRSRSKSRSHSKSHSHRNERDRRSPRSHRTRDRRRYEYTDKELDGDVIAEEDMKLEEAEDDAAGDQESENDQAPIPFKNDGSFLEMFKKMQEEQKASEQPPPEPAAKKPILPSFGKRRGGKVLKTGMVAKIRNMEEETNNAQDAWSIYMKEVRKYKEVHCDDDSKTRPLVK